MRISTNNKIWASIACVFIISIAFLHFSFINPKTMDIGLRYKHKIFLKVDVTKDVVYGQNYDSDDNLVELKMDVYEPHGDKANKRALIIFIHGGAFTGGDKATKQWVALCTTFAKCGYVTASINYRLQKPGNVTKHAITQAMHDAKAAIRYFRGYAEQWRIDENKIALVGGSAGAVTALHATYLTEPEYEGDSGNPGYSSNVSACIDLWGGLYDNVSKIDPGEVPVCIIHGTEDKVVPYSEALNISKRCEEVGVYCELHSLEGEGHAPWHLMDEFIPWMVDFLYNKMIKSLDTKNDQTKKTGNAINSEDSLESQLKNASVIMWIAAHPDDELYTAGTFGYFTRDLGGHLVIVSLYYNPDYVDNNKASSKFLGNATYIRIEEQIGEHLPRCRNWNQIDEIVRELERAGVKDYIENLILEYKPDIVFGFESTNGFRHSCQHVSFAKIVNDAVKELHAEGYRFFDYYYVLNRDPNWFGEKNMDPPPVTDTIELTDKMWNYKLAIFDIYSEFYPELKNESWLKNLQHKEWFRRIHISAFTPGSYAKVKLNKAIPNAILENDAIVGVLLDASWKNLEPQEGIYNWEKLDRRIEEAVVCGKKISLNIMAGGINTPQWLFDNYTIQTFTFIDTNKYHKSYLQNITIPVFWDSIFLEKKINFIRELGKRYTNNSNIVAVTVSFANAMTNDWNVPHYVDKINGGKIDQVEDWLNAGYTHEKMLHAGMLTIDAWAKAFPNQCLKLPIGITHEELDGSKTKLAEDIVKYAYEKYSNRFFIQINGLCTKAPYAYDENVTNTLPGEPFYLLKLLAQHSPNVGLQMLAAASNWYKDGCRLNGGEFNFPRKVLFNAVNIGLSYNPCFIEYWEEDAINSRLKSIIKYATDAMRNGISTYIEKPRGLCFLDRQIFPAENAIVFGEITIRAIAYSKNEIDRIEFYIDDILEFTDYEYPYEWLCNKRIMGRHILKVIAYDNERNTASDKINVIIFNIGGR